MRGCKAIALMSVMAKWFAALLVLLLAQEHEGVEGAAREAAERRSEPASTCRRR